MFINSFLIDTLIFKAAILTVFLAFVIIYILTGQSKLKALLTTKALQRVRDVEALNTDRHTQNCNSRLLKVLMILNLVIVALLLLRMIKKSIFFWGQPFSSMVKVKTVLGRHKIICLTRFESISQEYAFIQINRSAITRKCHPKKTWVWDVLEIKQRNIHIVLNNKEIHLPTMLLVPFIHKLKVRKVFGKRDLMHVYIMLKQRKSWYNVESEQE